ncbi:hypothetical protein NCC49_001363 [Naganishia albida]|nr:hypothetical protein NCC49_001363 [Naganishia albida]
MDFTFAANIFPKLANVLERAVPGSSILRRKIGEIYQYLRLPSVSITSFPAEILDNIARHLSDDGDTASGARFNIASKLIHQATLAALWKVQAFRLEPEINLELNEQWKTRIQVPSFQHCRYVLVVLPSRPYVPSEVWCRRASDIVFGTSGRIRAVFIVHLSLASAHRDEAFVVINPRSRYNFELVLAINDVLQPFKPLDLQFYLPTVPVALDIGSIFTPAFPIQRRKIEIVHLSLHGLPAQVIVNSLPVTLELALAVLAMSLDMWKQCQTGDEEQPSGTLFVTAADLAAFEICLHTYALCLQRNPKVATLAFTIRFSPEVGGQVNFATAVLNDLLKPAKLSFITACQSIPVNKIRGLTVRTSANALLAAVDRDTQGVRATDEIN